MVIFLDAVNKRRPLPPPVIILLLVCATFTRCSAYWPNMQWCEYRFYTHPETWISAKDICQKNNMTLANIRHLDDYESVASLIKSSLPALYKDPPQTSMWVGLYKPSRGPLIWQDDCANVYNIITTDSYSALEEVCFMIDSNRVQYKRAQCNDSHHFVCQATTIEYSTCFSTVSSIRNAATMSTSFPDAKHCSESNCLGYKHIWGSSYALWMITSTDGVTFRHTATVKALLESGTMHSAGGGGYVRTPLASICKQQHGNTPNTAAPSAVLAHYTGPTTASHTPVTIQPSTGSYGTMMTSTGRYGPHHLPTPPLPTNTGRPLLHNYPTQRGWIISPEYLRLWVTNSGKDACPLVGMIVFYEKEIYSHELLANETDVKRVLELWVDIMDSVNRCGPHYGIPISQENVKQLHDIIIQTAKLLLTRAQSSISYQIDSSGVSMHILLESVHNIKPRYASRYGWLILPHTMALRRRFQEQHVMIMVTSYRENPFQNSSSSDNVNVPVIDVSISNQDGSHLDMVVQFKLELDASTHLHKRNYSKAMMPLGSGHVAAFPQGFLNDSAAMIYIALSGRGTCTTYGIYGTVIPSEQDFDLMIHTTSQSVVLEHRPYDVDHSYSGGVLQIPLHTSPFVVLTTCQGNGSHVSAPEIKMALVQPKQLDEKTVTFVPSRSSHYKLTAGRSSSDITLQSYFFGTFSASVKLIPPDMIDFHSVFLKFSDNLTSTPHILLTIVSTLVILLLATPILRRFDQRDSALWSYHGLVDNNPSAHCSYYLVISTGMWSQRRLPSSVYINVIGTRAATGTRLLSGGTRRDFDRGTTSNFFLTTDEFLGDVKTVQIWLNDVGALPSWHLKRLLVIDGTTKQAFLLNCDSWLSENKGDGKTWRTFVVSDNREAIGLSDIGSLYVFDHNLLFSLFCRPQYCRFSRAQRLWCTFALLLLAMLVSAMFYDTPSMGMPLIKLGRLEIGYKEVYTGLVSSLVVIPVGLLITFLFSRRKQRGETYSEVIYKGSSLPSSAILPWWSIFIVYTMLVAIIFCGAFFTFLYSLEWGPSLTLKWMSSFFLGTSQSVFLVEPSKALILAVFVGCLCSGKVDQLILNIPPPFPHLQSHEQGMTTHVRHRVECPCDKPMSRDQRRRLQRLLLDRKLNKRLKEWFLLFLYVCLVLIISSHQSISDAFQQNTHLANTVKPPKKINTTEDVWDYVVNSVLHAISPMWFYNGDAMADYQLRFFGYNYRLGPIRLRQVRVSGTCEIPVVMRHVLAVCIPDFTSHTDDTHDYYEGWKVNSSSNMADKVHSPYQHRSEDFTGSPTQLGQLGSYTGSGYLIDLDFEPTKAVTSLLRLQSNNWLDDKTRALFVETLLVNRNNMLFSHIQIILEFPSVGGVFANTEVISARLYPYITTFDYFILVLQVIFAVIVIARVFALAISAVQKRLRGFATLERLREIVDLGLSIAVITFFVLKFTSTVTNLNRLRHEDGFLTSFGDVFKWNGCLGVSLGFLTFLNILQLLKPLSFNYHLHLMCRSIAAFRKDLLSFTVVLVVLIVGFSCLLNGVYGAQERSFNSMLTTLLTLLRIAVGIIKFRHDLQVVELGTFLIYTLFTILVSIVFMNMFLSALNTVFTVTRLRMNSRECAFDWRLNRHFWKRLRMLLTFCGSENESKYNTSRNSNTDEAQHQQVVDKILSKLSRYFAKNEKSEMDFLREALLQFTRVGGSAFLRSVRTRTAHDTTYTYSKENGSTHMLMLKFPGGSAPAIIDVKCIGVFDAIRQGIVQCRYRPFPISQFCIINNTDDIKLKCTLMLKVPSEMMTYHTGVVMTYGNHDDSWRQHEFHPADTNSEKPLYLTVHLDRCPRFVFAIRK